MPMHICNGCIFSQSYFGMERGKCGFCLGCNSEKCYKCKNCVNKSRKQSCIVTKCSNIHKNLPRPVRFVSNYRPILPKPYQPIKLIDLCISVLTSSVTNHLKHCTDPIVVITSFMEEYSKMEEKQKQNELTLDIMSEVIVDTLCNPLPEFN